MLDMWGGMLFNATPTIFQFYHCWWRNLQYLEKTTDLTQVTDKLYPIMYQVHLAMSRMQTQNHR